jgi:hypothetical protein
MKTAEYLKNHKMLFFPAKRAGLTILIFLIFQITSNIYGYSGRDQKDHPKKQVKAIKSKSKIKIDGQLTEAAWAKAPTATNFITYSPSMGKNSDYTTKVKTVYNDKAIYFGAFLKDKPDSIIAGLSKRDEQNVNADRFWVTLNPFNDGKNIFKFIVTAANVQSDVKISPANENKGYGEPGDAAWDAVWKSSVSIVDSGWVVEMEIPYDAIRFPKKEIQKWGINFWRTVRRERKISSWDFVDRTMENEGTQYGELVNLYDIEPPLRLSLYPYVSGYIFPHNGNLDYEYSAGMDLKYGINESFTLDMILIPDFGQKKSDETVLNLSPYEIKYDEKRQFFTEGTELFNKAGLFYSRRIGDEPSEYNEVQKKVEDGEKITDNPDEATLINATKISGRTPKGLGLGFFNATTANTHATVEDTLGNTRKILTQPWTNYNLLVIDKNFGRHSYANFINTNYLQPSTGQLQNVLGSAYKISDKTNQYALWGTAAYSMQKDTSGGKLITGQAVDASIGKVSGNFKAGYNLKLLTDEYDHNALGYLRRNNELTHNLSFEYGSYEPSGIFLDWNTGISFEHNSLYNPNKFSEFNIKWNSRVTFKNHLYMGAGAEYKPVEQHDYFEPRVPGKVFDRPESFSSNLWISSDYRKPLALDIRTGYNKEFGNGYFYSVSPRIRIGNKTLIVYEFRYDKQMNERGYVTHYTPDGSIIFGRRDNDTYTNSISSSYIFNNKSWISLDARHYWSQIDYDKYYKLQENGDLNPNTSYSENADFNYNVFTVDLMYSWNFAPGSFLKLVWKNNIYEREDISGNNFYKFFNNLENTLNSNKAQNSFSVKISYYLDYKYLFNKSR